MPTNRKRPKETREMRLFGRLISLADGVDESLPEFIARRRTPGAGWRSWDELSFELAEVSGEIVTDGTLRQWAKRYGIPEDTERDVPSLTFSRALRKADIVVREVEHA